MPNILVENLSFSYSSEPLLENISFQVGTGERACIVGPNGCGKSTLLKLVSGVLEPDHGSVSMPRLGISPVSLDIAKYTGDVAQYLHSALTPLRALISDFEQVSVAISRGKTSPKWQEKYDNLLTMCTQLDVWNLDNRVDEVLQGLGLGQFTAERFRPLDTLSPGQRARLQLAATLIMRPSALILDEPTNHLDHGAISYLTELVGSWHGPVLMTSHDRMFIEDTATVIYDLDVAVWRELAIAEGASLEQGVHCTKGKYTDYLTSKRRAEAKQASLHQVQQSTKRQLAQQRQTSGQIACGGVRLEKAEGSAKKFFADRAATTAAKRINHVGRKIDVLAAHEVRKPRYSATVFEFPETSRSSGLAISVREAAVPGRLQPVTFDLAQGEKLLLTGHNGAGKTTLLNWLACGQAPHGINASGLVTRDSSIALVPQELPTSGNLDNSYVVDSAVGELGKGFLHPAFWQKPIAELSAGNQRRVQIALALQHRPKVLLIDEPTNYLDLDALEAFELACKNWNGTLVVASHDRWLIKHWVGQRLELGRPHD